MIGNIVYNPRLHDRKTPAKTRLQNLNAKLIFAIFAISFGPGFQHGYHIGVMNISKKDIQEWIENKDPDQTITNSELSWIWSLLVAMFSFGGVVGSLLIAFVSRRWGRKSALLMISSMAIVALILLSCAKIAGRYELIMTGRFFIGIHAGLTGGIVPLFLVEISPTNIRGGAASVYQLMITISILTSQIFGSVFKNTTNWYILFIIPMVPVLVQLLTLPFCPESPMYLYFTKSNEFDCEESLAWYRNTWQIETELGRFKKEKDILSTFPDITIKQMYNDVAYRTPVVICMFLMIGQQFSGINAVMYYSDHMFAQLGYSGEYSSTSTCIIGTINVLSSLPSIVLIETVGRRKLLLLSYSGMMLITITLTISLTLEANYHSLQYVNVISIVIYIFCFAIGNGPVVWAYPPEIFPYSVRGLGLSLTLPFNWVGNMAVGLIFVPAQNLLNFYVFIIFLVVDIVLIGFIYTFMPDTNNKSNEEIIGLFR